MTFRLWQSAEGSTAPVCFSATADVVGGLVIGVIGIDVLRRGVPRRYAVLSVLPLLLGAHQLVESFVWWGLQGHVPAVVGHVAMWVYLIFAFIVLPVYVPIAILALEPVGRRRMMMVPFVALGVVVACLVLVAMVRGPVTAGLAAHFISYSTGIHASRVVVMLYVTATCGALIVSGIRDIARFGVVNMLAVALLAHLTIDGFASLWCAWAAICSAAFSIHLRMGDPTRAFRAGRHPSVATAHSRPLRRRPLG